MSAAVSVIPVPPGCDRDEDELRLARLELIDGELPVHRVLPADDQTVGDVLLLQLLAQQHDELARDTEHHDAAALVVIQVVHERIDLGGRVGQDELVHRAAVTSLGIGDLLGEQLAVGGCQLQQAQ